jgi:hypothetical protein
MLLAIDVGIKHLAYCLTDLSGIIHHWSIVNLVAEEPIPPCVTCGKPAKASSPAGFVCGRHIGKDANWIVDKTTKSNPTVAQLQAFLEKHNRFDKKKKEKREELLQQAKTIATMWLPKRKNATTFATHTCAIHDSIRAWITRDWHHLSHVTRLYIEHQPVLKNPVMKTVQLLVFTTLRERLLAIHPTECFFVHAGKKIKGAEKGDAGYADRKQKSEERLKALFDANTIQGAAVYEAWKKAPKKSDMADALCMTVDYVQLE